MENTLQAIERANKVLTVAVVLLVVVIVILLIL